MLLKMEDHQLAVYTTVEMAITAELRVLASLEVAEAEAVLETKVRVQVDLAAAEQAALLQKVLEELAVPTKAAEAALEELYKVMEELEARV